MLHIDALGICSIFVPHWLQWLPSGTLLPHWLQVTLSGDPHLLQCSPLGTFDKQWRQTTNAPAATPPIAPPTRKVRNRFPNRLCPGCPKNGSPRIGGCDGIVVLGGVIYFHMYLVPHVKHCSASVSIGEPHTSHFHPSISAPQLLHVSVHLLIISPQ